MTNGGFKASEGDGGNTTVHYYYSSRWQILETRNGSNQVTRQWAWGFRYVDEPIFMDVNRAPTHGNDCDPDVEEGGGNNDARYYYQQDRNWNVVAVLESDFPPAGGYSAGVAGRLAERYAYTPYGEFVVLRGDSGSGQLGNVLVSSYVGSPFAHQGLAWDAEKASYQNRWREYATYIGRFGTRDPLAEWIMNRAEIYIVSDIAILSEPSAELESFSQAGLMDLYLYVSAKPTSIRDALGLADDKCADCFNPTICGSCGAANAGATCTRSGWKWCRNWFPCCNTCCGVQTCTWTLTCARGPLTGIWRWRNPITADGPCR